MKISQRKGSALLIVLGMLSFMVISAIGFSVYMRQNRLPSSFVRRNTSSHELLQAALARAMNEIDSAIGDDEFPGLDGTTDRYLKGTQRSGIIHDSWRGRVFLGVKDMNKANPPLVDPSETISTLSLEGLAYLPPALVNDVRYFSRRTPTAVLRPLAYDAGNYAYTAVNVSDYIDVNEVLAGAPRTSDPTNRVSLAYLFVDEKSGKIPNVSRLSDFQKFVDQNRPFVSLADFNLALKDQVGGYKAQLDKFGFGSTFGDVATGDGEEAAYYGTSGARFSQSSTNQIVKTTFITDSFFDVDNTQTNSNDKLDLWADNFKGQPFKNLDKVEKFGKIADDGRASRFGDILSKKFSLVLSHYTWSNLYDYLDYDDVPVSLAFPSVERVPMLGGLSMKGGKDFKLKIERTSKYDNAAVPADFDPEKNSNQEIANVTSFQRKVEYRLPKNFSIPAGLGFRAVTPYPFKYREEYDKGSNYKLEARLCFFFGEDGIAMRGSSLTDYKDDLAAGAIAEFDNGAGYVDKNARVIVKSNQVSLKLPTGVIEEENAFAKDGGKDPLLTFESPSKHDDLPVYAYTENWTWHEATEKTPGYWQKVDKKDYADNELAHAVAKNRQSSAGRDSELHPYMALKVRIINDNGDTVDMVPASIMDDKLNGVNPESDAQLFAAHDDVGSGDGMVPVLLFKGAGTLKFNGEFFDQNGDNEIELSFEDKAIYCADPRWNHAPENWQASGTEASTSEWLRIAKSTMKGADKDIFMNSSDSGRLQSISELAFLPRLTRLAKSSKGVKGVLDDRKYQNITTFPSSAQEAGYFWRTLSLTREIADKNGDSLHLCSDTLDDDSAIERYFEDSASGYRVNPLTDDSSIFKAALAYTPYDWNAAAPSDDKDAKLEDSIKKTFSDNATDKGAKLSWDALNDLAAEMQASLRDEQNNDWLDGYNALDWGLGGSGDTNDPSKLFGVDLGLKLHGVDRKFLYGFWRGCFENRQQLFILFLRAEPMIAGCGSGKGAVSAQLGARAVAVVWRDPNPPKVDTSKNKGGKKNNDDDPPHKMRVLFYKVLE